MKVSKEQVAENRANILQSAARLFRERGFDAVTLDDVMKEAGLTRGAFYGHFKSKDELAAQAVAFAVLPSNSLETKPFKEYIDGYLSEFHKENRAGGCPYAALATEVARQPLATRHEMTEGLKTTIDLMAATAPGKTEDERRTAALAAVSSIMGALILARMSDDRDFSSELLEASRRAVNRGRY